MRKAIIRTTLALAIIGGVGVVNSGGAQALPLEIACHQDYLLGLEVCALATDGDATVPLLVDTGVLGVTAVAGQFGNGPGAGLHQLRASVAPGGALLAGAEVTSYEENPANGYHRLGAAAAVGEPGTDNLTVAGVEIENDQFDPDEGNIFILRSEPDTDDVVTEIVWHNGDCEIRQEGVAVAPCIIQAVPQLPYIPFVWLP